MGELKSYKNDEGLELHINHTTGEVFASIRAVARMCDRNESTLRDFVSARKWELKMAEIHTPNGLRNARLLDESQILECFVKYKPDMLLKFASCGLRVFLHGVVGYRYEVKPTTPMGTINFLEEQLKLLKNHEERIGAVEGKLHNLPFIDEGVCISGYFNKHGIDAHELRVNNARGIVYKTLDSLFSAIGRKVTAKCAKDNIEPQKVNHPKYGSVNVYPPEYIKPVVDTFLIFPDGE